jgi:two-component sensor histidine kinase
LAFLQGAANILGMAIERDRHEQHLKAALTRHRFLLKEMNHRIKNSLTIVTSMLGLQARQAGMPALSEQLRGAVHRVVAIARAHELLYQEADVESLDLGKYVESICTNLRASLPNLTLHVNADHGIEITTDSAISSALIINELIANAAKYAYQGKPGDIWATISRFGENGFSISVRDEGKGLPADFDPRKAKGLGMRLVTAFARQIGGSLEIFRREPGTEFVISVSNAHRPLPMPMPTDSALELATRI